MIASDDIRTWLDTTYPLKGKGKESVHTQWDLRQRADFRRLQGLPSQEAYDKALALAQLVLGRLLPAYLISLPAKPTNLHLRFPIPPALAAGLITPLPASLTGDTRNIDKEEIVHQGMEALDALETVLGSSDWALDAT